MSLTYSAFIFSGSHGNWCDRIRLATEVVIFYLCSHHFTSYQMYKCVFTANVNPGLFDAENSPTSALKFLETFLDENINTQSVKNDE